MKTENITYILARLPIGLSMFGHGLIRLTKLQVFSSGMVNEFSKSILPVWLVQPFSYALPFLEFLVGILLLLGLFIRFATVLGVLIMLALIFGTATLEQWNNIFTQMIYGVYFALLFRYSAFNFYSLDSLLKKDSHDHNRT
jgi:thiosulfate dehydrogenase [quinone] large subunit